MELRGRHISRDNRGLALWLVLDGGGSDGLLHASRSLSPGSMISLLYQSKNVFFIFACCFLDKNIFLSFSLIPSSPSPPSFFFFSSSTIELLSLSFLLRLGEATADIERIVVGRRGVLLLLAIIISCVLFVLNSSSAL